MSTTTGARSGLLIPALEAARKALRKLDADEVPAALRRVAAHSGPRLPPPMARRLTSELDASDWLREKALEEASFTDDDDEPRAVASRLFLTRPERWWSDLAALEAGETAEQSSEDAARHDDRVADLEARLAKTRRRLKQMQAERDALADEARRRVEEARKELKSAGAEDRVEAARLDALLAEERQMADKEREARSEVERFAARLRADLMRAKQDRAATERRMAESRTAAVTAGRDPFELARALDDLAARARPPVAVDAAPPADAVPAPSRLPAGVRPDAPEAVDWLVAREDSFLLLVDGYNVSFLLSPEDFTSSLARDRVNQEVARVAARMRSDPQIVVVYDSSLEGERTRTSGGRGVDVVFAQPDRLADDEIVARAGEAGGPVVVVSTDREVREQADRAGAVTLWSDALVAWLRRSG